jgi:hypothetical protein
MGKDRRRSRKASSDGYSRRDALLLIGGGALLVGPVGSNADTNTSADRTVSVAVSDDKNAFVALDGVDPPSTPTEPQQVTVTNQTGTVLTNIDVDAGGTDFEFADGSQNITITNLNPGSSETFSISIASAADVVTDTISLLFVGGSISVSADRTLTISASDPNVTVTPDPAGAGQSSEHTWLLGDYTSGGDQIDTVVLDYSGTGASFDGLDNNDVTVTLTRQLSSGPDRSSININQDSYSGETATIDLSGTQDTSVVDDPNGNPNIEVVVNGVDNPPSKATYTPEIKLNLDTGATDTFPAQLEILDGPFFDVDITGAPSEVFEGDTFDIDYEVTNIGTQTDTQDIELEVNGTVERTNSNVQLGSSGSLQDTFTLDESNLSQSPPYVITVQTGDDSASRTVEVLVPNEFSLTADPDAANSPSTHTWEADPTDFEGEVDTITVDYPSGFSFNGLNEADITVTMERQLSSGPDTSEIDVNSDTYSGSVATFDLSGNFNTDLIGLLRVEINGIENAGTGQYQPTITLDGANDNVQDTADLSIQ